MELRIDSVRLGIENVVFAELNKLNILHLFGERFKDFSPNEGLVKLLTEKPFATHTNKKVVANTERFSACMNLRDDEEQYNSLRLDGIIYDLESLAEEGFKFITNMSCFIEEDSADLRYYDIHFDIYMS